MRKVAYALLVFCAGCLSEPKPASLGGDGGGDGDGGGGDGGGTDAEAPPRVTQIATGFSHTCALISDGRVRCWGSNSDGQLGYGNTATVDFIGDNEDPADAGDVNIGGVATQVVAGNAFTCILLDTGDVRCWGRNSSGQLGIGNTTVYGDNEPAAEAPIVALGGQRVIAITAGANHACALLFGAEGDIICWGASTGTGSGGELGYGNSEPTLTLPNSGDNELPGDIGPVPVSNLAITSVTAGPFHTCSVLASGGSVRCWGQDNNHQLGIPGGSETFGDNETAILAPSLVIGSETRRVGAGSSHSCALSSVNGLVHCWGFGGVGNLGYGNTNTIGDGAGETPESAGTVTLNAPVLQLVVGPLFTCALLDTAGDPVRCWGDPASTGRLGIGIETPDKVGDDELPIDRPALQLGGTVESLSISNGLSGHTCAILTSGEVRCWGDNTDGQLGYGHTDPIGDTELPTSQSPVVIL